MNRFIYTLLLYVSIEIAVLKIITKERKKSLWKTKLKNQLGFVTKTTGKVIWIHCVSVGEFNAARPLIDQLFKDFSDHKLVITTTTITGAEAVKKYYHERVTHHFFPFDEPLILESFIKKINPLACILLETEIWPNLAHKLNKKRIPVVLVNARLSERSFKKYQKFSSNLIRKTINKLTLIATQNNQSSERFLLLGAQQDKVITTGNLKFDSNELSSSEITKSLQNIVGERKVVVFASTRDGEEKQIIQGYLKLKHKLQAIMLIIPRHPERFDEVFNLVNENKLNVKRRSDELKCDDMTEFLIGDSMGEMMSYYSICDIAFIGGSLSNTGGQNMLEAAASSKPIIYGPSVFNFEEVSKMLLESNSALQVNNADELMQTISDLLSDNEKREKLGLNAKACFESHRGAVTRLMNLIKPYIKT